MSIINFCQEVSSSLSELNEKVSAPAMDAHDFKVKILRTNGSLSPVKTTTEHGHDNAMSQIDHIE